MATHRHGVAGSTPGATNSGATNLARRRLLRAGLAASAAAATVGWARPTLGGPLASDWLDFRRRFVMPDGRVLDTANGNVSHSEGQGAGLLFAVRFDDEATFTRILAWTRGTLRRVDDSLLAWRYRPGAATPVGDMNNASDGDLMVAWALAEAAERWGRAEHRALAAEMGRDILRRVVLPQSGGGSVLLPGTEGFRRPDHLVVNPSYYIPPAFRALGRLVPSVHWRELEENGLALADGARFGRWRLPADWVALPRGNGRPTPASGWPARFSYDALRVPLYLAWGGHRQSAALRSAVAFWGDPGHAAPPAWVDLRTDVVAPYPGDAGLRAIEQLAIATISGSGRAASLPGGPDATNYYSAILIMLSRLAWSDLRLTDAPACPSPEPGARTVGFRGGLEGHLQSLLTRSWSPFRG